jgi:alkylhydroperoxidase family enzyme
MPALVPLDFEELAPDVQKVLAPRVARLGYLGDFFRYAGRQPGALLAFNQFTEQLRAALPDRLAEVVALTVAGSLGNRYERHQHERLCVNLGFERRWIEDVLTLAPSPTSYLEPDEQVVQASVLGVIGDRGRDAEREIAMLIDSIGPDLAVAVLLLTGRYVAHALFCNALAIEPPVSSIVEEPA